MKRIILATEFLSTSLFCPDLDSMGHVDMENLPISSDLKIELALWNDEFQKTFDSCYPPDSSFPTPELAETHAGRGRELAKRLQEELGDDYLVEYKI